MRTTLFVLLFLCSIKMYGQLNFTITDYDRQSDYVIKCYENSLIPFYIITPTDADSLVWRACKGKTQYNKMPIPVEPFNFWRNEFIKIQNIYLSSSDLEELRNKDVIMGVNMIFDCQGNIQYVEANLSYNIFDVITKEQVISMYRALWKIKVPMNNEFDNTQYYKGHILFLRYD